MNKAMLIEQMASHTKLPKTVCKNVLEAFMKSVEGSLKKGKSIILTGFGTFTIMKRKARVGINPSTGKKMQIPAKRVPKFKPGKKLKEVVL
ncbi:TPA: DNA-binding protein [Candidatus Dependentiae bacterium]|nr:MAG: Histone family protein DNA-binding protein [candidate division TM6 bacterium GW2011_GWE2_31_21]KKP52994.1 MAG: Histone family protein DNA-binding protein [candidate division TM6 bacterium GW2011_GWF2_33_332]HBS47768.1 DNA-binding protein [Candidatus Dependentiae bacterium]HBZ73256.1 DNA-binding protein [Candidatus Dependentiae bacterium]